MKKILKIVLAAEINFLILFIIFSCNRPTQPELPNSSPTTTIANIPKDGDTIFALQTLYWNGGDNDGFVAGYEYRYITYHLFLNDSVVQDWRYTKETSLTVAFISDDILNKQKFQVRAIDNNGNKDVNPAEKIFYTKKTVFPKTTLVLPEKGKEYFANDKTSDWWQGVKLVFTARDQNEGGAILEYAWAVDNGSWNWTTDTSFFITPDKFSQPLTGKHLIKVTSRNNTNLVDPVGDSVELKIVKPSFTKKILIIDETDESNFPFGVMQATDSQVDSFYNSIFNNPDQWDYIKSKRLPSRDTLGQYKLIVWHADDLPFTKPHSLPSNVEIIKDYLNVGGKFFMSGWRILKSFAWLAPFPLVFKKGDFVYDYLHIINVDETPIEGDCTNMIAVTNQFNNLRIDSLKLTGFPYLIPPMWGLGQVNLITQPGGFTDRIFSYDNLPNSPYYKYRGRATGLRYYGSVFDAVILGFPVFFINKEDAAQMVKDILKNLNMN